MRPGEPGKRDGQTTNGETRRKKLDKYGVQIVDGR